LNFFHLLWTHLFWYTERMMNFPQPCQGLKPWQGSHGNFSVRLV
jgi:hypothetical protein